MAAVALLSALGVTIAGMSAQGVGLVAAADPSGGSDIAPWLQGGGSAAAVGGLVYVARLIVQGKLVPRPVADYEREITARVIDAGQREAKFGDLAEKMTELLNEARARETSQMNLQGETTSLMHDVRTELRRIKGSAHRSSGIDQADRS